MILSVHLLSYIYYSRVKIPYGKCNSCVDSCMSRAGFVHFTFRAIEESIQQTKCTFKRFLLKSMYSYRKDNLSGDFIGNVRFEIP